MPDWRAACQKRMLTDLHHHSSSFPTGGGNIVEGYTRRQSPHEFSNSPCTGSFCRAGTSTTILCLLRERRFHPPARSGSVCASHRVRLPRNSSQAEFSSFSIVTVTRACGLPFSWRTAPASVPVVICPNNASAWKIKAITERVWLVSAALQTG